MHEMYEKNPADTKYILSYLDSVKLVAEKLKKQEKKIAEIIEVLFNAWRSGHWVFIMGNGGSASTASHFAADLVKTIAKNPGDRGIRVVSLCDNIPLTSALVNDWGWPGLYENLLATYETCESIGIGISVHGGSGNDKAGAWSQNLLRGLQYIKDRGGRTIGFSGFDGGPMKKLVDICVVVPANSTPLVESFHVVLHHLITFRLKERIESDQKGGAP